MWNWYLSTFYTRLEPGAAVIICATRWHEDDLIGRLLKAQGEGRDQWRVVNLPALAEPGDMLGRPEGAALWPWRYDEEALAGIRKAVGSYTWAGMYQQRPAPPEGSIFQRRWWKRYAIMPSPHRFDTVLQSWDLSFKDTSSADYAVCQVWGRIEGDFYLLDQVRDRMDFPTTVQTFKDMARRWPQSHLKLVEDAANGPAVIAALARTIPGIVAVPATGSKEARAHAVTPFVEAGNVYLPEAALAPWIGEYIEELSGFPNATFDDQVDATTQALSRLGGGGAGNESAWRDDRLAGRR